MKKLFVFAATAATLFVGATVSNTSLIGTAQASSALAQNLCTYVEGDDRLRMRQRLREDRVQLRRVYTGIMCNGKTLLQFAMESGSNDIGEFISSQLPGSVLEESGDLEWAESNGFGSSPIADAIRSRIGG